MSDERKSFKCEILTPRGEPQSSEVVSATFPAPDGQVGILAGRAPMVSAVGAGTLTIELPNGTSHRYYVRGGFAQVTEAGLKLMIEDCVPVSQLDAEKVWDEIQAARKLPVETQAQREHRQREIDVARVKFKVAQSARKGRKWGLE